VIPITFHYRYRKQIIIGFLIVILLSGGITGIILNMPKKKEQEKEIITISKKEIKEKEEEQVLYTVDIKGEINAPGIYELSPEKRIIDVITKAGGLTENADTSVINLSKKVQDEMVIIIYSKEEVNHFKETKEQEKQVQEKCYQIDNDSLKNDACISKQETSLGKISINHASMEELQTLKGIGESKARDIIAYREANGPFQSIEEIINVPGIGESRFAAIKEDITIE